MGKSLHLGSGHPGGPWSAGFRFCLMLGACSSETMNGAERLCQRVLKKGEGQDEFSRLNVTEGESIVSPLAGAAWV